MVKERPGGPQRAYGRVQKRVEGPKSASLSVEHSRRYTPRQRGETSRVRKFVCKEIVVLVLRRERHLFYLSRSLAQLPALFVTPSPLFSLSLTLSLSLSHSPCIRPSPVLPFLLFLPHHGHSTYHHLPPLFLSPLVLSLLHYK